MKLDPHDRRILEELQRNAKISNQHLSERVGLSPSPCSRRVKALEGSGVIARHVTLLEPSRLGLSLMVLVHISMDRHTRDRFEQFEEAVRAIPEVLECYLITGQAADYLLKVVARDIEHYEHLLLGALTRIDGVSGVHSSFVLRRPVNKTELPLA